MGLLHDKWVATYEGHSIEVHGDNHVLRGLVFELWIDGAVVAEGRNTFKLPGKTITLQGNLELNGLAKPLTVVIKQHLASAEYHLEVDGKAVPLRQIQ